MHISPQKYTEARKEGNRKWDTANLDRVSVAMPKGKKDIIKAHAEARSESVNGFINRASATKALLRRLTGIYRTFARWHSV